MKLILAQPATPRFQWELEVLLANVRQFTDSEVILLFLEDDFTVPICFREKPGVSVFVYDDRRDYRDYLPATRPYLLWHYFKENPEAEKEQYFYIDSDIIFREWIDFATLGVKPNKVIGSTCDHYIGHGYILGCRQGADIAAKMAEICGITTDQMKGVPGIGAHIGFENSTAEFWKRCYFDSISIYQYLEAVDSNIQKWTAEMWAQLWGWVREGKTIESSKELDFRLPTDDISKWEETKILHNAGIAIEQSFEYFFKGEYADKSPFGRDFSHVRKDKLTQKYVDAIKKVVT